MLETIGAQHTIHEKPTIGKRNGQPQNDLESGTEFAGRYVIDSVLGRGGMGVVYKAKDTLTDRTIALKLIRPERASGEGAMKRLIAEGTTARDIRHKNVVSVYDVGEANGQPFVSMEFADGQSLRAWHRNKANNHEAVPVRVAARIIAEILDGLKAAHENGVVHRDLKPENIILMGEPDKKSAHLKILDFGIANVAGAPDTGTSGGLGTIGYMAPEQKTNPSAAAASADIYSVSVLFYELLMDVQPTGHWQPPSSARSDVPIGIDRLIETGLSNRPASRPQSAAAFRKTLVDAINRGGDAPARQPEHNGSRVIHQQADNIPLSPKARKWLIWGMVGVLGLIILDELIPDDDFVDPFYGSRSSPTVYALHDRAPATAALLQSNIRKV